LPISERRRTHHWQSYTQRSEPGQTVYVFGAGASASEGDIPTNANLLQRILEGESLETGRSPELRPFIKQVYDRGLIRKSALPSFEEVFTFIELALETERYFKGWGRAELLELRRDLLIGANRVITEAQPSRARIHELFLKNLFKDHEVSNLNTSCISFNYDTMLDLVLVARHERVGDIDYGCYFRSFDIHYEKEEKQWDPPRRGKELFLLKLHGSFNWNWCPVCNFARIYPTRNISLDALMSKDTCGKCGGRTEAMLVPPAWTKNYRNPNIINIWLIAEFLLSQAETIVFVGSSFSDADAEFKFLLRRALTKHKRSANIVVVSNKEKNDSPTYERYFRFFGELEWVPGGFQKFAEKPIHQLTPSST
jgi:hypothetical protein